MKNAAMIIVSAIMGFLILGIVLTIGGSMNRRCEVETILPSTMEKTVEGMPFAEAGCSSGELVIAECVGTSGGGNRYRLRCGFEGLSE